MKTPDKMTPIPGGEIRYSDCTTVDEIVAHDVRFVHFEWLDDGLLWCGLTLCDGSILHVNISNKIDFVLDCHP